MSDVKIPSLVVVSGGIPKTDAASAVVARNQVGLEESIYKEYSDWFIKSVSYALEPKITLATPVSSRFGTNEFAKRAFERFMFDLRSAGYSVNFNGPKEVIIEWSMSAPQGEKKSDETK